MPLRRSGQGEVGEEELVVEVVAVAVVAAVAMAVAAAAAAVLSIQQLSERLQQVVHPLLPHREAKRWERSTRWYRSHARSSPEVSPARLAESRHGLNRSGAATKVWPSTIV